ncbi:MAG: ATP-binding protein, partial [Nanoarchaeota archaeon]|nr:ATP-binding protein [Nanoarchaeota archaeon]
KWTIIDNLEYLRRLGIFSTNHTSLKEIVQPGMCTIINLKGIEPEIGEIIVYKLLKDLFDARKKDIIPPFFAVVEEAHNFSPERSFGETKCSRILRTIASEGRKFGLGLCVVSQRPARVDKSVLSQCNTQIILKVTNPNDLRAISGSVEGITMESESEIKNLPIGTALITGIVEMPLFVNIRPRRTKHGGISVNMVNDDIDDDEKNDFLEHSERFKEDKRIPLIKPKTSKKDIELMSEREIKEIKTYLVPAAIFTCKEDSKSFDLLVELTQGKVIIDTEKEKHVDIPEFNKLSPLQMQFVQTCMKLESFTVNDIMQATGLNFIKTQDMISTLSRQGYFEFRDGKYSLSKSMATKLDEHAYYGRIEFDRVDYEMLLDKAVSTDSVKEKIERFADVTDIKDCFIVWYKVIYAQDGDLPKE